MKKLFVVLAAVVSFASQADARVVDLERLDPTKRYQVEQMLAADQPVDARLVNVLNKFEEFGSNAAKGIVAFAKELGVAANEFVQTPLGLTVGILIGMHVVGPMVTSLILGILFLFVLFPICLYWLIKSLKAKCDISEVKYVPTLFGLYNKKVTVYGKIRSHTQSESIMSIALGILTALSLLAGSINFAQ